MDHEILPMSISQQEFDAMMREFDDAQSWMIEQLRRRPQAAVESIFEPADVVDGVLGGEGMQGRQTD